MLIIKSPSGYPFQVHVCEHDETKKTTCKTGPKMNFRGFQFGIKMGRSDKKKYCPN